MANLKIDEILKTNNRVLRAYPGKLLFGPTAERLFADCLDKKPGFCGHIDFIHKVNLNMLFEVECSEDIDWFMASTVWYPSHLVMTYKDENVEFEESKHININDIAFSKQTWKNTSDHDMTLTLKVEPVGCVIKENGKYTYFHMEAPLRDYRVGACVGWSLDGKEVSLAPGEEITFIAAASAGNIEMETEEEITKKLHEFLSAGKTADEYVKESIDAYQNFFDNAPQFTSSNKLLDKTWWYRWYILRNATSNPNFGYLKHPTVYEGRAHKTGKMTPLKVSGWEFSRLINLSSPLHMTDYRWYPDKEMLHEFVRGYLSVPNENGVLQSAFTNHIGGGFFNFIVWAIYRLYLVDGDKEFIKEILPQVKRTVDGNIIEHGAKNDYMQIVVKHQRTGKEYQPSHWYFTDFPLNGKDKSLITPLKRMDSSVYHYLNMKGLALMMKAVEDPEADKYMEMAETLASQINEKCWDEETEFYYDLHHETDEKAMVKNIVGVYPYWANIASKEKLGGLEKLFDPELFNTGSVFSTVAKDCPVFTAHGGWRGIMLSRDSCVWDGPSWPYTNGIAIDAIGRQSKVNDHRYDEQFKVFLEKYAKQHYRNNDINEPYLVEQYHAITGENLSDEPDYNHSYFNDLIVTYVAGVDVCEDCVVIDPLDMGLSHFTLKNLWIRGKVFEIALGKDGTFTVTVDGEIVSINQGLAKVTVAL